MTSVSGYGGSVFTCLASDGAGEMRIGLRDATLSPGRAISLLTRSLPHSCGDLCTVGEGGAVVTVVICVRVTYAENAPKRNNIPALVPPLDHDGPAIKDGDVPRARQLRIERWLS